MGPQLFFDFEAVELACSEKAGEEQINGRQATDAYWWISAGNYHRLGRLRASHARS